MRILHIISAMGGGGAEMLVKDLSLELRRAGHDVAVAYFSSALDQGNSVELEVGFKRAFATSGIPAIELGHKCRRNPVLAAWRMRKAIRQFNPDIVHAHLASGLVALIFSGVKVKAAYTHHNVTIKFSTKLFKLFDRAVERYIAICDVCKLTIGKHVKRPVVLIRNAIATDRVRQRQRRYDGKVLNVLSVGYISEQKNYPLLLEVAKLVGAALAVQECRVIFKVAGDGPLIDNMRNLVQTMDLIGTVEFLGPRRDVADLMSASDLLLMTSLYEGLPLTLVEALHTGLPIVATDVGGCNEAVVPNLNGYLSASGDARSLAGYVVALALDGQQLERMAAQSLLRSKLFSMQKFVASHLRMYEAMLATEQNNRPTNGTDVT